MKHNTALVLALVTLPACIEPKIDTSSEESMKTSIERVRAALPDAKRPQFDSALQILVFSNVTLTGLLAEASAPGAGGLTSGVKASLSGKTANGVLAAADSIREEEERKERETALQEIAELERKKAEAGTARAGLARFRVLRSRFYRRADALGIAEARIELTVENGTDQAVSRAHFDGVLASPGRSVPWLKESFNHQIPGGLEPSERVTWELVPNMFGAWGRARPPADAVLTVEVVRLDGPRGETLFSSEGFGASDAERLAALRSKYP